MSAPWTNTRFGAVRQKEPGNLMLGGVAVVSKGPASEMASNSPGSVSPSAAAVYTHTHVPRADQHAASVASTAAFDLYSVPTPPAGKAKPPEKRRPVREGFHERAPTASTNNMKAALASRHIVESAAPVAHLPPLECAVVLDDADDEATAPGHSGSAHVRMREASLSDAVTPRPVPSASPALPTTPNIPLADGLPARAADSSSSREMFQPPPAIRSLKAVEGNWGVISEALETVGLTPQLIRESRLKGAEVERLLQAFYVYTSGFFSLLEEIFGSAPNRAVLLGRVWTSFAMLIEKADAGDLGYKSAMAAIERSHQEELARQRAQAQAAEESANARGARQHADLQTERLRTASALGELETVREQLESAIADAERGRERLTEQQRLLTREEEARRASDASAEDLKVRLSVVKAQLSCIPSLRQQIAQAEADVNVARAEILARDESIGVLEAMLARVTGEKLLLQHEIANIEPQLVASRGAEIELATEVESLQRETVVIQRSLERSQAEVGRLETLAAHTAMELKSAAAAYQLELAQLTGERDDAQQRAKSSREEVDSLKCTLENKVNSLENAEESFKQLEISHEKLTAETSEQKIQLMELIADKKHIESERDRALEGKKRAVERYDGQEASMRYLQDIVDGHQAELREQVSKVQRKVDALDVDLKAKDISAMALQSELKWSKCTVQELETQLKELNAQANNFSEREAALVARYEYQLEHERRLNASVKHEEKLTETKCKKLAAEQHEVQLEVLNLLTNLKLNELHESVMQMVHATEQQEVMITHLAPFRDSFFDVDVASAALSDVVEPMQEARDAAFEMYMLELDQSRAFEHTDGCLERLCDQLDALAAQAGAQLAPLADEAAEADRLLPGFQNRVASLESELAALQTEAKKLQVHMEVLEEQHTVALKQVGEKAVAGSAEMRRKHRTQLKQLLALKEMLDDAEYEISQWAVGAIRNSNMTQWRKTQELKKAKNAPALIPAGLDCEVSEDSFDNDFHEDDGQAGGTGRAQRRSSLVRDSASIAAAAVAERKNHRAKDGSDLSSVLSGDVSASEGFRSSKMLWNRGASPHTVGSSRGNSSSMGSGRPESPIPPAPERLDEVNESMAGTASVAGEQAYAMVERDADSRI